MQEQLQEMEQHLAAKEPPRHPPPRQPTPHEEDVLDKRLCQIIHDEESTEEDGDEDGKVEEGDKEQEESFLDEDGAPTHWPWQGTAGEEEEEEEEGEQGGQGASVMLLETFLAREYDSEEEDVEEEYAQLSKQFDIESKAIREQWVLQQEAI
ncbi:hypothetical protein CPB84DRAFT_1757034 [Gymnopilus junonius]|uniref:Uncharacterized protein n=1 Tax=Gymnopilus junonius TaxID=109634 RepID=A0A9P5N8L8_GYMJU|nr:hypothetical protein CPB84DRAFT_1757034 [Gymnopilus junonius]